MARNVFFRDIRRAVAFMSPRVEVDNKLTDAVYIESMLKGTDHWISIKVVDAFQSEDFPDLSQDDRNDLAKQVANFLEVAKVVDPKKPATPEQHNAAIGPFLKIVQRVQGLIRKDWLKASTELLGQAETWANESGWPTKRYVREAAEEFIGTYSLERLVYSAEAAQLALIPVGRFAPGTEGMFDLAVMPAYDSVMVVRKDGFWHVHQLPGAEDIPQDWSKDIFVERSLQLARLP